jgi:hypothetical protein
MSDRKGNEGIHCAVTGSPVLDIKNGKVVLRWTSEGMNYQLSFTGEQAVQAGIGLHFLGEKLLHSPSIEP